MSSIIKSISLNPKTAAIAKKVPNFSRFVRECLIRWDAIQREPDCPVERMGHPLVGEMCVPSNGRICMKHWPNGTPTMDDWRKFREMIDFNIVSEFQLQEAGFPGFESPQSWVLHRADLLNRGAISFDNMDITGNAKPENDKRRRKKRSLMAKLLPFLAPK